MAGGRPTKPISWIGCGCAVSIYEQHSSSTRSVWRFVKEHACSGVPTAHEHVRELWGPGHAQAQSERREGRPAEATKPLESNSSVFRFVVRKDVPVRGFGSESHATSCLVWTAVPEPEMAGDRSPCPRTKVSTKSHEHMKQQRMSAAQKFCARIVREEGVRNRITDIAAHLSGKFVENNDQAWRIIREAMNRRKLESRAKKANPTEKNPAILRDPEIPSSKPLRKRRTPPSRPYIPSETFYVMREWREVRYEALKLSDGRCSLCGRSKRENGVVLHVDHIKPRSIRPDLQFEVLNLQVLCEDCNIGKSNYCDIDWRAPR